MNYRIIRVRSTKIIPLIEPRLVFNDPESKAPFIEELAHVMTHAPESLLVLAALDDDDDALIAYTIVQNPGIAYSYASIAQVWSNPSNSRSVIEELHARVVLWAMMLGKTCIRGETQRDTAAILHRFGYEPIAQIYRLVLDGELQESVIAQVKEALHGRLA